MGEASEVTTKTTELRLIAELMKDCRRSDRQLAKALGVSQPTVSRLISKLEKRGLIKEYTCIPDFSKLGFTLMAITFVKDKPGQAESLQEGRKSAAKHLAGGATPEGIIIERGIGMDFDGTVVSFHHDYSSYKNMIQTIRKSGFVDFDSVQSFLIDLDDKVHYRSLTFQTLAEHVLSLAEEEKKPK